MVKWLRALWQMAKEMASGPTPPPVPTNVVQLKARAQRRKKVGKVTQDAE
jgi:hypothetical protein